jgi:hypothetical protein
VSREVKDVNTGRLAARYDEERGLLEIRHGKRRDVIDVRQLHADGCQCYNRDETRPDSRR